KGGRNQTRAPATGLGCKGSEASQGKLSEARSRAVSRVVGWHRDLNVRPRQVEPAGDDRGTKMSDKRFYPIVVGQSEGENGGFLAYAPDLGGCMCPGETAEQAVKNAQRAVNEWLDEAIETKRVIPLPSSATKAAQQANENYVKLIQEQRQTILQIARDLNLACVCARL